MGNFAKIPLFLLLLNALSAQAAAPTPVSVFTETAEQKPLFNLLTYPARVESRVKAVVRSEADGAVTKILRPLGSRVNRGDVVAIVKHTDPVYNYAPLNILASVSGVVNEVNVTPGSLVVKGDPIISITDPAQLRIIVEVAANDVRSLRSGQKGELMIAGFPQTLSAEIQGISPSVDPALGTATCEMKVSTEDQKKILPGMVGQIQFKVNQRKAILLPDSAIAYRGTVTFVRIVENGIAKRVPVTIGEKRAGIVEVLTGVKEGDQVIDRASRFIAEGDAVQVEKANE